MKLTKRKPLPDLPGTQTIIRPDPIYPMDVVCEECKIKYEFEPGVRCPCSHLEMVWKSLTKTSKTHTI